jgi:hypothetical protein
MILGRSGDTITWRGSHGIIFSNPPKTKFILTEAYIQRINSLDRL